MTTVISVRGIHGKAQTALMLDPGFVYVGRKCAGWGVSVWGNPYKPDLVFIGRLPKETAETRRLAMQQCLALYAAWVKNMIETAPEVYDLSPLRGKRLGCWCGNWSPGEPEILCHAVVLAKLADRP